MDEYHLVHIFKPVQFLHLAASVPAKPHRSLSLRWWILGLLIPLAVHMGVTYIPLKRSPDGSGISAVC